MRVIFLGIDGVLNKIGCKIKAPSGVYFVEDDKILLLKELIEKTGAKVVLSSTWRSGWKELDKGNETIDSKDFLALRDKLKEFNIELFDYTGSSEDGYRGKEVLEWIESHLEDIDSILILDDDSDLKPLRKYHLKTSFVEGLKPNHIKKGINILLEDDFKEWYNKKIKKEP